MRRRSIALLAAALALALAGCGTALPNPLASPTPPDALHPNQPPVLATTTPAPDPTKLDELARHRGQWTQAGIRTYRLQLLYGCQCGLGGGKPIDVTVVDGLVTDAAVEGRALTQQDRLGYPMTVDELFDYADRNASAGKIELKYDDRFGYPVALGVDPDLAARDDEIRVIVTRLVPGR